MGHSMKGKKPYDGREQQTLRGSPYGSLYEGKKSGVTLS